jgi:tellurite resistance protein
MAQLVESIGIAGDRPHSDLKFHAELKSAIEEVLATYDKVPGGGVVDVRALLVYDQDVTARHRIKYDEKVGLVTLNYPTHPSANQDVKNSVFRSRLDLLLRELRFPSDTAIRRLTVIVGYNSGLKNLIAKGRAVSPQTTNEEAQVAYPCSEPRFRLQQVMLGSDTANELDRAVTIISKRSLIYEDWGFAEVDPKPRAILNFHGPPGTGKTMTAHGLASELKQRILCLNYADVESKFVGDAPKNLVRAFETAARENAVLFFDEADSFLGKRITGVSTSSDQAVNSLRSQMLILLEEFSGVVVFASNLLSNYDRAFESRILKHIRFELPDISMRKRIISAMIPSRLPFEQSLTDAEIGNLAAIAEGFSGREIRNAMLESLVLVAREGRGSASVRDFERGFDSIARMLKQVQAERAEPVSVRPVDTSSLERRISRELARSNSGDTQVENSVDLELAQKLCQIGMHAALADGTVSSDEVHFIQSTARSLGVSFDTAVRVECLPTIEDLAGAMSTPEERARALEFAAIVVASDGHVDPAETDFVVRLASLLGLSAEEAVKDVSDAIASLAESRRRTLALRRLMEPGSAAPSATMSRN